MQRRHLLRTTAAGLLAPWARLNVAAAPAAASPLAPRLVVVLLRGGMDGLAAVPALGDPAFADARGALGVFASPPLPLDGSFALHPLLPQLHALYGQGELLVLHAAGLPYQERSHFDAQQVLESGGSQPHQLATGWLGRAVAATGSAPLAAVALETAVPLVLRGPVAVDTWAPSTLPEPGADLVARLVQLYQADPPLARALARAQALRAEPGMAANPATEPGAARSQALLLARKAADFLQRGSQVAVLELGGWDSHANQVLPQGALANNLRTLDSLLATLRDGLLDGPVPGGTWGRTAVLVVTEFGRAVAPNGTGGTDHGSGGAAFVLGGAVRGGRVLADWPGLAPANRFEGRDLRVTTDLRAAMRALLVQHLQLPPAVVDRTVLPGSAGLAGLDLVRSAG